MQTARPGITANETNPSQQQRDALSILNESAKLSDWERVSKELLETNPWHTVSRSPTGDHLAISDEETGKTFRAAAKLGQDEKPILRSHLVQYRIDKFVDLHGTTINGLGTDGLALQKNRLDKAVTREMKALLAFGLFRDGPQAATYLLTDLGLAHFQKLNDSLHSVQGAFPASYPQKPTVHKP